MPQFSLFVVVVPLLLFYLWMFWDMVNNDDIPHSSAVMLRWPPITKLEWAFAFVLLNVVAAGFYYLTVYREN